MARKNKESPDVPSFTSCDSTGLNATFIETSNMDAYIWRLHPPFPRTTCFDLAWEGVDTVNLVLSEMDLDKGINQVASFMIRTQAAGSWHMPVPVYCPKAPPPRRTDVKLGCGTHVVELISTDQCQYVKTAYRLALNR